MHKIIFWNQNLSSMYVFFLKIHDGAVVAIHL